MDPLVVALLTPCAGKEYPVQRHATARGQPAHLNSLPRPRLVVLPAVRLATLLPTVPFLAAFTSPIIRANLYSEPRTFMTSSYRGSKSLRLTLRKRHVANTRIRSLRCQEFPAPGDRLSRQEQVSDTMSVPPGIWYYQREDVPLSF